MTQLCQEPKAQTAPLRAPSQETEAPAPESPPPVPGPTGEFPDGRIDETDEGGINIGIAADLRNRLVRIDFGTPIAWLAITADQALAVALAIRRKAIEVSSPPEVAVHQAQHGGRSKAGIDDDPAE